MCEDAEDYGPRVPPARRQLFFDEDSDETDDEDEELAQFLEEEEVLAEMLVDEDEDDLGFDEDFESDSDDDDDEDESDGERWSDSSIEVLTDSGSSIEVLGDDSADYTDEGMIDDGVMYSPYQPVPPTANWNANNMYYPPISPINPSCIPWSPESWSSRDLYSPMSTPSKSCHMAGDGPYASTPLDDSCAELPPMWWDVTDGTYKTADDTFDSSFWTDSSYYSANNSDFYDGCY